mgnify:CR=1 FL=1
MEREKLGSRLGFIFLSAGCAIGIGNVWRFPYITGLYGGGVFVLFYLFFLVIFYIYLLKFFFYGDTGYDDGICGRTCQPKEYY